MRKKILLIVCGPVVFGGVAAGVAVYRGTCHSVDNFTDALGAEQPGEADQNHSL